MRTIGILAKGITLLLLVCFVEEVKAQDDPVYLLLKSSRQSIRPTEFFVSEIQDVRAGQPLIGEIYTSSHSQRKESLEIRGGVVEGVGEFVSGMMYTDRSKRPVVMQVSKMNVSENSATDGKVKGQIDLSIRFLLEGDSLVHLLDYDGGARYTRSLGSYTVIGNAMEQSLGNALKYFNEWMDQQAPRNIKLATGLDLEIIDYPVVEKGDTVFYHEDRKLDWDDFKARPHPGSSYAASIFTSFSWEGDPKVEEGRVKLELIVKVFMLKSSSWARSSRKDGYGLNHEQRHFDITKIVVERFKEKIREMSLTPQDYDGRIGYLYIETYREMNKMQEAYDDETDHGRNKGAQQKWNELIDRELAK
ncbi:hypothetical protein [Echinicola rosea]|uniref:Uncharacterized protein n=1 Tax=Echinicola rosea TaxID=1807691 RepID=A0ABQ1UM71_9BACT|nr:hypothetical protein [Echinicola rosea]GGF20490.1 hypothetical protein GCM10011339_05660 [Echinicola rosea]